MEDLDARLRKAVEHFWLTRARQDKAQGGRSGQRDAGNRRAATGGKQLDGFTALIGRLLVDAGIPTSCIHAAGRDEVVLPGYFRPTKQWDLLVTCSGCLLAAIEVKSLCGPSFGNNYNNRVEEALGSSTDVWTAYREGAFRSSPEPFVGYVLLLEEHPKSLQPVGVVERHFPVFPEFQGASYVKRCEHTVRRLIRERCYSAASFLVANRGGRARGDYSEPAEDLGFPRFAALLQGHVGAAYRAASRSA